MIRLTRRSFDALPPQTHKRTHSARDASGTPASSNTSALSREVFKNGRGVNGNFGADTHVVLIALFEVSVDTADGEL